MDNGIDLSGLGAIQLMEQQFHIKLENFPKIVEIMRQFSDYDSPIAWVSKRDLRTIRSIYEGFDVWGWWVATDDTTGDIIKICNDTQKLGDVWLLFDAIAPYVTTGSRIQLCSEDGYIFRFYFDRDRCTTEEPVFAWPQHTDSGGG